MEKAFAKAEELAGNIKEYVNTKIESVKLNTAEKSSAVMANIIAGAIVAIFFVFFIIFAGIAFAFYLGKYFKEDWKGFLAVAVLYFLFAFVIWFSRNKIFRLPIMNSILKQLTKNDDEV